MRAVALAILNRIKVEMSDDDETLRLLEVEYQRLGTTIDKFDEQRFKVKGWTITAAGALVALGINTRQIALLIAAAPITLFFALIEVLYLHIHVAIIERSNEIEGLIDLARRKGVGAVCESYTFGIGKVIKAHTFKWRDVPALLPVRSHITYFYLGIVLSLIVGAVILANI
jgi:hypothetical protein